MTTLDRGNSYFTLPPGQYYTDPEVFAEEYSKVFTRQWLYVGHVSEFSARGSFVTVDIAGESVIVVRGDGESFHAHFNVCRHRGYPLCDTDSGTTRSFVCPYHQWHYDLDGRLRSVPHLRDGDAFDYREFGLKPVHVDVWKGLVFIHLGAEPVTLADSLRDFESVVEPFQPARTRVAHTEVVDFEANWKTSAENFNECYHCAGTHPSLCRATDVPRMQLEAPTWFEENPDGVSAGGDAGMPLNPGYQTLSIDGSLISSLLLGSMGEVDARGGRNVGMNLLPNYFYAGFYVDHWWAQMIWPISTTRSRMTFKWYVHEDAVEGQDYDVANLVKLMQTTYLEDIDLIERTYRGVSSRTYESGPIVAKNEPLMLAYVRSYYALMGRAADGSRLLEP